MTVTHSTLGILSAVALCTLAGCGGDAVSPLLFAQWDGEEPFAAVETAVDTSPSGKFAVEYAWDDPDTHGNYQLTLRCVTDGRTVLLGRGTRGAVAKWRKSQIGDLLIVEYQEDTHFSRLFVLQPRFDAGKGALDCRVLYSSPEFFPPGPPPEHAWVKFQDLSEDGVLKLLLTWDYATDGAVEKTVDIPLFYGRPVK